MASIHATVAEWGAHLQEAAVIDPLVKATPVNSLAAFVRARLGEEKTLSILDAMGGQSADFFSGRLMAHQQVPLSLVNDFTTRAAVAHGEPVESFAHAAGRFGAEQGLKTVYKFIMVLMSPESVLKTAPLMWKKVYDRGEILVETGKKTARITVRDFPANAAGCGRITGWFEVIGEKTADEMSVAHAECRVRGDGLCAWNFQWK